MNEDKDGQNESIQCIQSAQIKLLNLSVASLQNEVKSINDKYSNIQQHNKSLFKCADQQNEHKLTVTVNNNESNIEHDIITKSINDSKSKQNAHCLKLKDELKSIKHLFYKSLCHLHKLLMDEKNIDFDVSRIDGFSLSLIPDSIKAIFDGIKQYIIAEKTKINALNLENQDIKMKLTEFEIENEKMRNMLNKCRKTINIYKKEEEIKMNDYQSNINKMKNDLSQKQSIINMLNFEKDEYLNNINALKNINQKLKESMSEQCDERDNFIKSLKLKFRNDLIEKMENMKKMEIKISEINEEKNKLCTKLQETECKNTNLKDMMNTSNINLKNHSKRMSELIQKNTKIEYELENYKQDLDELHNKYKEKESELNENKQELILLTNQHQFVVDNLQFEKQRSNQFQIQLNHTRNELENTLFKMQENKEKYQQELFDSNEKYKNQARHYQNICEMYKQLKRDISSLKQKC